MQNGLNNRLRTDNRVEDLRRDDRVLLAILGARFARAFRPPKRRTSRARSHSRAGWQTHSSLALLRCLQLDIERSEGLHLIQGWRRRRDVDIRAPLNLTKNGLVMEGHCEWFTRHISEDVHRRRTTLLGRCGRPHVPQRVRRCS